ncbi:MAG: hypothetical protein ACI8WL_000514 [Polaribacter sp.]|jgi:hypothetical protein|tara:strand:- start:31 stop:648 length:618 start_codon:yes stop_codon:yes gene_type:complete
MMKIKKIFNIGCLFVGLLFLASCSSTATVEIDTSFPAVLAKPGVLSAVIIFDDEFASYVGKPNENTSVSIGKAQVNLLKNAFSGLFSSIEFASSIDNLNANSGIIITPSVRQIQVSTPSEHYLNVFEVWIKYNLKIETADGRLIVNWFMPAYGKTPDVFMSSKERAIEQATIIALRDAGAKLLLDFYRIPALNQWITEQQKRAES